MIEAPTLILDQVLQLFPGPGLAPRLSICENSLEFTCSFWIIPREGEVGAQVREVLPVAALLLLGY